MAIFVDLNDEANAVQLQPGALGGRLLRALGGNDTILGSDDPEDINGNLGNDLIVGQGGNDTLRGGQGLDTLLGGPGNDELYGNRGEDIVDGGEGNDSLFGGQDNDTLLGGTGNDRLAGDIGIDVLQGGAGANTFVLQERKGRDTLQDFAPRVDGVEYEAPLDRAVVVVEERLEGTLLTAVLPANTVTAQVADRLSRLLAADEMAPPEFTATAVLGERVEIAFIPREAASAAEIAAALGLPLIPPGVVLGQGQISAGNFTLTRGQSRTFTVSRPAGTTGDYPVLLALEGTATRFDQGASDYRLASTAPLLVRTNGAGDRGTVLLTIRSGNATETLEFVSLADNDSLAGNETVNLYLGETAARITLQDGATAGTTVSLQVLDSAAREPIPNQPIDSGAFELVRTGNLANPLTVSLSIAGSATNGTDYSTLPSQVTFTSGNSRLRLDVLPLSDNLPEAPETVILSLLSSPNYAIDPSASSGTVRIVDALTGTGDVQVTLTWNSPDDLDLAVIDPRGIRTYFGTPQPGNGSRLDVDANAGSTVSNPVENIFFERNQAPRGTYTVEVNLYNRRSSLSAVPFSLTVIRDDRVDVLNGSVSVVDTTLPYENAYRTTFTF